MDYLEQTQFGRFGISSIKEYDSAYMISPNDGEEDDHNDDYVEPEYYKIVLKIEHEEQDSQHNFIIKTADAESGKKQIESYLAERFANENRETNFIATIISAKTIPCESIIDMDFCEKYLNSEKSE